jgi:hypothetical protein
VREEYDGEEAVLIRHLDDNIQFHVNQSYYTVQEKYIEELEEIFKDVHVNDKDDEFTIQGKEPEVGFYISERTEDEKMGLRRGSTIDGILDGGD